MFGLGKKKKKKKGEDDAKEQDVENEEADEEGDAGGDEDEGGGDDEGGGAAKEKAPKKSKKKLILAVVAVLVLAGVGAGVYFSGILGGGKKKETEAATIIGPDGKPIEKPIFYTLPDFLVNLNATGKQASYLKAIVILELAHQTDVPLVEINLPRVSDAFTTYLRELRPSDLAGSAGIQRLREELLLRVNRALAPVKVNDVLFKDIVVQ